ncbi:hypothetical protein [Novosphingobium sp. Gsoil 351]|uniref:hypothetical protein n=1 Tax=Novosphingobium sp. Gsoil 351 TaxID=2675225 RepID=UPI0012B4745F|nr:hypothetical protein [Novosphingobium sp. Gsoil 351]QGN55777.1 hypothetical protein GKE62_15695 [Novosphingobium sp. Gsoil 351]
MSNWIIEADIYRLEKALAESPYDEERSRLRLLLGKKRRLLNVAPPPDLQAPVVDTARTQLGRRGRRKRTPLALL